jgi:very-short-patch-repair endonuclease
MAQPIKKGGTYQKPRSKTVRKKKKLTREEIIKRNIERSKKPHPKYGTSKLEKKFAKEFLEKLGIRYEEQFEAKDIKRFYDFFLPDYRTLVEVDGSWFHSYGLIYEEMNPMQKRNARVDEIKNEWAALHGYPLIRIWEHDINENPQKVLDMLRERLGVEEEKLKIKENKKKRH